jgi:hypothetical protein
MRTRTEYEHAKGLLDAGHNQCEVARQTGIPRGTIKDWAKRGFCPQNAGLGRHHIIDPALYVNENEERRKAYSYILGEYLGDGCVRTINTTYRLDIYNDKKYEGLNQLIQSQLRIVFPYNKVHRISHGANCWDIYAYSNNIPLLFPQMGKGKKHDRKIELTPWQLEIVDTYPNEFIKGLFYSDGCIYQSKYNEGRYCYRYYNFLNRSKDIADYLSRALAQIGIIKPPRFDPKRLMHIINIYSKRERDILGAFMPSRQEIPVLWKVGADGKVAVGCSVTNA